MTANHFLITMRTGPAAGQSFQLKEESTVGRDLACEISLSDPEISRKHARFFTREDNIYVEDLGSTNGTFLNGERIASPQQLRIGDVITLGESVAMVFDKVAGDVDLAATLTQPPQVEVTPPTPVPLHPRHYEPEVYTPPAAQPAPYYQPEPAVPHYEEELYKPAKPKGKQKAKREGLPTWMMVLIVAIVMLVCVIAVTMYFMPAEWWCAITFDSLAGCPLP
mgnify:CR=1 FL=1